MQNKYLQLIIALTAPCGCGTSWQLRDGPTWTLWPTADQLPLIAPLPRTLSAAIYCQSSWVGGF